MQINLCLSSDENYARHVGFTLYSALVYSQACDQYEVYVLDGGISPESKRDMQDKLSCFNNLRIHYVDVRSSSALDKCRTPGTSSHITLATYYRFLIPSLIPCDKVLYLDCDILVCHDLHELFEIEIEEYYMGAAVDPVQKRHWERRGGISPFYYVNAGILLINNKRWREENVQDKLFRYMENPLYPLDYMDQDVLNDVLKEKILYISPAWNMMEWVFRLCNLLDIQLEQYEFQNTPKIIHYTGPVKPWHVEADLSSGFVQRYQSVWRVSPWKEEYRKIKHARRLCRLKRWLFSIRNRPRYYNDIPTTVREVVLCGLPLYRLETSLGVESAYILGCIRVRHGIKIWEYHQSLRERNEMFNAMAEHRRLRQEWEKR